MMTTFTKTLQIDKPFTNPNLISYINRVWGASIPQSTFTSSSHRPPLIDEIHTKEMQYQTPKHKIRKRPIRIQNPHQPTNVSPSSTTPPPSPFI